MRKYFLFLSIVLLTSGGCAPAPKAPRGDREAGETQAQLSTDAEQKRLWQEAATSGATAGIEGLSFEGPAVTRREVAEIPDRKVETVRQPYPEAVRSALTVMSVFELEEAYSGSARVTAVEGEFLTLELAERGVLTLQAKVRGGALSIKEGEAAELLFRVGDPFARNDVLALKAQGDDLLHALVGADEPVSFQVEPFGLAAAQIGKPEGNMMSVQVTSAGESHTLWPGDQAMLRKIGLTVELRASVAVQGESAHALPGRPYRVELIGWRTVAAE